MERKASNHAKRERMNQVAENSNIGLLGNIRQKMY